MVIWTNWRSVRTYRYLFRSGGVGFGVVQLAKARGAFVWAVTSPAKSDALRELGADETISRETDLVVEPGSNSMDVVIDLVAGDKWP